MGGKISLNYHGKFCENSHLALRFWVQKPTVGTRASRRYVMIIFDSCLFRKFGEFQSVTLIDTNESFLFSMRKRSKFILIYFEFFRGEIAQ